MTAPIYCLGFPGARSGEGTEWSPIGPFPVVLHQGLTASGSPETALLENIKYY